MAYIFSKCDLYNFVHLSAFTVDTDSLKVEITHLALFQVLHDPFTEHIDTLHHLSLLHNPASYDGFNRWRLLLVLCEYKYSATQKLFNVSQITAVICEYARKCYIGPFSCGTLHKEEILQSVRANFGVSFLVIQILPNQQYRPKSKFQTKKFLNKEDARVITICYFRRNIRWYSRFKQFHKNLFGQLFQYTGMSK